MEEEFVNSSLCEVERTVNRWLLDFYFSLALESFQKEQNADFLGIRRVLDSVLDRPLEFTDATLLKLVILKFLSRITEGENTDVLFEQTTPLESALILLEQINQEFSTTKEDFENVCTSLKEAMVVISIKNDAFEKAEEVLNQHFPKPMVGKKAIFMGLIRKKSKSHEAIQKFDFQQFKEEMLFFCQRLGPFNVPFLHKAAKMYTDRLMDGKTTEPGLSFNPQISINIHLNACKNGTITKSNLEVAYQNLAADSDKTFAQVDEELVREEQAQKELSVHLSPTPTKGINRDSELDGLFQRDSSSPMEASPADQAPHMEPKGSLSKASSVTRKRLLCTVSRLVVEPDSQGSSQCSAPSQELETEVETEEPPQSAAVPNKKDLQSPVTDSEIATPTRKHKRSRRGSKTCRRALTSLAELSAGSVASREASVKMFHNNQSISSLCRKSKTPKQSSDSEEDPPESPAPCKTPEQSSDSEEDPHESPDPCKTPEQSSDSEEDPHESPAPCKTPEQNPHELASIPLSKDPRNKDQVCITDSALDRSPNLFPVHSDPGTSSTPHKKNSAQDKDPSKSKWKTLFHNAKESKDVWSDEESYCPSRKTSSNKFHNESTKSHSGHRKKMWTDDETQMLRDGIKKFGEGRWHQILAHYPFKNRTNVQLKDRWRTMKNTGMV